MLEKAMKALATPKFLGSLSLMQISTQDAESWTKVS